MNKFSISRRQLLAGTTGALLTGSIAGWSLADDRVQSVAPFKDPVVIRGTPRERGRFYGRHFSDAIHEFLDREITQAFAGKHYLQDEMLRYADACWKVIQSECPIIADELQGFAEGTGLRLEDHILITLHEELYHRGVLPPVSHCTAVAVGPPETAGATFVGQTWDWMPTVAGMSTMLEWRRDEGPSLLAYAFPGLWVGAGVNSAGLALCWTSADLGKPKQTPRVGLPSYVFLAHLLYQPTLEAVKEVAQRNRHAGWFTFVMADGTGRLMNVEGSPARIEIQEAKGRLVRVGFGTPEMAATPAGSSVKRHPRCQSMDKLLDNSLGRTDAEALKQDFGDPARGICVGKNTIDMMVFDTTARSAQLSRGAAYEISWREYRFTHLS